LQKQISLQFLQNKSRGKKPQTNLVSKNQNQNLVAVFVKQISSKGKT